MFGLTTFAFLKSKLGGITSIFLGVMALIFVVLFAFNADTILTRFGFETKTSLKGEVVSVKKDLEAVLLANSELQETVAIQDTVQEAVVDTLQTVAKEKERVSEVVVAAKEKVRKVADPIIAKNKAEKVTGSDPPTMSKADSDAISTAVIDSLHSTYNELFPTPSST